MRRLTRHRPSAPAVINLLALFIVLGGHAVALTGQARVMRDDLAPGAVTARNLAPGAVTAAKLADHALGTGALARQAVGGSAIAPGAVHGGALLGTVEVPATIPDADPVTHENDFTWTGSGATAACPAGTVRLDGGVRIQDSSSHRGFLQSTFPSGADPATWAGEISTDSGGASPGLLLALCLR